MVPLPGKEVKVLMRTMLSIPMMCPEKDSSPTGTQKKMVT